MSEIQKFVELFNETASEDNLFEGKGVLIDNIHIYCDKMDLHNDFLLFKKSGVLVATAYIPLIKEGLGFEDCDCKNHSLIKKGWVMK